jgi:transposase-like protein
MKRYSEEEKTKWLTEWEESGKSRWIFAKLQGLNPTTFDKWIRRRETGTGGFVEISKKLNAPNQISQEILIEKGNIRVRLPVQAVETAVRLIAGLV